MSTHGGDIYFDIVANDKPYKKTLGGLDKVTGAIGKKLAGVFAVASLGKFVQATTKAGASLNAMNAIVDTALPNMTKQVDDFAKSAGQMFGLSETQAKGFVGKFASMSSAMGYTEKQAYAMSTALTGLAGDVASYYHISQDEAFAKLGAVFTGETESLKQLGVIMTQNALDAFALEHGFGRVTSQMSEMEKTTLRYQFVMDRLKLTTGDFARYANTWSGSIATIKLNWSNFMATMGQGIINILLPLLRIIAKISNVLTSLGARFKGWTERITGKNKGLGAVGSGINNAFGKKSQKDMGKASNAIGDVGKGLGGAGKSAKGAKKAVQALKRELLGFDQITKLTSNSAGTGSGGVGSGGVGGGGLGEMADLEDTAGLLSNLQNALNGIKIPEELSNALDHLKSAFSGFFSVLKDVGAWAVENVIQPLANYLVFELSPRFINTFASAVEVLTEVLRILFDVVRAFSPILKPLVQYIGRDILDTLENLDKALRFIRDTLKKVQEVLKPLLEKFTAFVEKVKANEGEKNITLSLTDKFSALWKKVKSAWTGVKNYKRTVTLSIKNKFSATWNKIKKGWNSLKNKTATVTVSIKNALTGVWNAVARKVKSARSKSAFARSVLPDMPYLAQGAYVKKNTPQLAVIGDNKHEGEVVAPESKLEEMANKASGNAQTEALLRQILTAVLNIDPNVYLDGEAIKRNTVKRINQHTLATGNLELII